MLRAVSFSAPQLARSSGLQRACTSSFLSLNKRFYSTPTPAQAPAYTPPQELETITTTNNTNTNKPILHKLNPPVYAQNYGPSLPDSFAIIHVGGKQYKVTKGDIITTETLQAEVGEHIVLDKVLMVGSKDFTAIGAPILTQAKVAATIEEQTRLSKLYIFRKKRRKNFQKTKGHRQNVTVMRITDIFMDYPVEKK